MALIPSPPEMTPEEFRLVSGQLQAFAGLHFHEEMKYLLERRLAPRLAALGLTDFGAYARYLRYDPGARAEVVIAADLVLTHETYFFREVGQLRAFVDEVLPGLLGEPGARRRIRIWSAGCSTGEEAYTLAMLLLEKGLPAIADVSVFGTDLSRRALTTARAGVYGPSSLRSTPPELVARYFRQETPGRYSVVEPVRALVTLGQVNLLDPQNLAMVGTVDAIFCRNVMIYFDAESRRRVLQTFYEKLTPGGFLMLGHSENLINLSADFELVHLPSDLVYRRPPS